MSSEIIYLYIKQHSITGLKYFGKTTKIDPYSYKGSGKHWLRHIKKHGRKYVETIHVWKFTSLAEATEFALRFSSENNIVESDQWANIIVENAHDGRPTGSVTKDETRTKITRAKGSTIRIGNDTFPSITQAAKTLFPDYHISVARTKVLRLASNEPLNRDGSLRIIIDNVCYDSYGKAAKRYGVERSTIRYWVKTGRAKKV